MRFNGVNVVLINEFEIDLIARGLEQTRLGSETRQRLANDIDWMTNSEIPLESAAAMSDRDLCITYLESLAASFE